MPSTLSVSDEIDAAGLNARHWWMVAILALVTLFDGYDVFAPAYVIPFGLREWGLKPSQAGLLVSSGLVGFMLGSLSVGAIADRIGRKPTLIAALLVASLLNLVTAAWVRSFDSFLALRLCTGIGLGMLLPLAVTIINETGPRRSTNLLVGCVMVGWSVGGVLAPLTAIWLAPHYGWPALFWFAGFAVPLVLACLFVLHETPRFLASRGRHAQAGKVLGWLRPDRAAAYADASFEAPEVKARAGSIAVLFKSEVRRSSLAVWLCAALSLFAIYGLSSWLPQLMIQRGQSFGASFGFGALLQTAAVIGGVACGWAADRRDKLLVLQGCWWLGALAVGGLAVSHLPWADIALVSVAGFMIMGAQPVLNNLTAGLYPTEVRSTGVGMELGVGRLGGILGPYIGGWLQQVAPGSGGLLLAMAAALALSALAILLVRRPARS